jgi:endo-1,4-beta-xylanase
MNLRVLIAATAAILSFVQFSVAADPEPILLWPQGAPGSEGKNDPENVVTSGSGERAVSAVHKPTITPFLPPKEKANGAAILVIPGGGHSKLCIDHEGVHIAKWLNEHGIAAFMLKHRLAREKGSTYTIEGDALPDTQRAMRMIRARGGEWGIDPARVGAMGFSAGGELVSLASLRPGAGKPDAADPLDRQSARPDFQVMIYPGRSADIVPTKDSPPAFLACGEKDRQDISEGLAEAYLRFKRAGVSAELHVFAGIGHGFGFRPTNKGAAATWPERLVDWMDGRGFLAAKP